MFGSIFPSQLLVFTSHSRTTGRMRDLHILNLEVKLMLLLCNRVGHLKVAHLLEYCDSKDKKGLTMSSRCVREVLQLAVAAYHQVNTVCKEQVA